MKFKNLCLIFVILSEIYFSEHVVAQENLDLPATEDEFIRNLFMKNLEEDYRDFSNEKLTPTIAKEISRRYKAFRESRLRPDEQQRNRIKRDTNEEGKYVCKFNLFSVFVQNLQLLMHPKSMYQNPKRYSLMYVQL